MRLWGTGGLALGVLALDQLTKVLVRANVERGEQIALLLGVDLVHVRNTGVAFSLFSGGGTALVVIPLVALLGLLAFLLLGPAASRPLVWLPSGLILGGALGNLVDRVRAGAVTDFIDPPYWPAFNVADVAITFGVVALLWVLERRSP